MAPADLTIVHLSDLHIGTSSSAEFLAGLTGIVQAVRGHARAQTLLILFTGDIAFSGKAEEYAQAKQFLEALVDQLNPDFPNLGLICIPGNHDVNLSSTSLRDPTIKGILQSPPPTREQLIELADSQAEFFQFTRNLSATRLPWPDVHVSSITLPTAGGQVQITALNTASCSRRGEEPSTLFVAPQHLPPRDPAAVCHVVLMHHPLHWLHQSVRTPTADWLCRSAEIVLTGHEHELDQLEILRRTYPATQFFAAMPMDDPDVQEQGFQLIQLTFATRTCDLDTITRSASSYCRTQSIKRNLSSAEDRDSRLRPARDFVGELERLNIGIQHKGGKSVSHSTIFVYPNLRIQAPKVASAGGENAEFIDGALLADRVIIDRSILVVGEEYAGKTFLFRQLVKDFLAKGMVPLLLSARDLRGSTLERAVRACILAQYTVSSESDYFASPISERVLLVEDLDMLPDAHRSIAVLSEYARTHFGCHVFSCKELMLLSDPLTGESTDELWSMSTAIITPFSHAKRSELISRWVSHDSEIDGAQAHKRELSLEGRLNELLAQKAVPALPMALTLILESMDSRDEVDESTGAFGYHYQRLILQALQTEQGRRMGAKEALVTDDIALELLGRIAFAVFKLKRDIDLEAARAIAVEMRNELLIAFSVDAAIETLVEAGLLRHLDCNAIGFPFKYIHQYSVAKLFALWLNNDLHSAEVRNYVGELTSEMHSAQNASILIFFTFLTRDSNTIRGIVEQARSTFVGVKECDFGKELDGLYLVPSSALPAPSGNLRSNRRELNEHRDASERMASKELDLVSDARGESRKAIEEIDKAFQCMLVLGQVLRAYPTRLSGDDKKIVATECYRLGLRTLTRFAAAIEENESFVKAYFRRIAAGCVDAHNIRQFEEELERQMSRYLLLGSLAIVKRIARAVGSTHLKPLYPAIEIVDCERCVKLVNRAIGLELLDELKHGETASLFESLQEEGCKVASLVLQRLVWEYLLLKPVSGSVRQSILRKMEMTEHPAMLTGSQRVRRALPRHS